MQTASPSERRTSMLISAAIGVALVVFAVVFIGETDSWYLAFKAIHVALVVLWVGGGTLLTVLAMMLERADDPNRLVELGRLADWAGTRLFAPASILVLVFGIAMMLNADLDWGEFWIIFGLIAWAASAFTGIVVLTPRIKRLTALMEQQGATAPESQALLRRILLIARVDVALLLLTVVDMTVKPFS